MVQRFEELKFDTVKHYSDVKSVEQFEDVVIPEFRREITEGDLIVIYFSGHGFSFGSDNFLVPTGMTRPIDGNRITKFALTVDTLVHAFAKREPGLIRRTKRQRGGSARAC